MGIVDLSRYRQELIEAANIICSFLNEEEKKALEITKRGQQVSFRDQIVVAYHNKYLMNSLEETKKLAEAIVKNFKPFFKLKDDNCGINRILLDKLDNLIFEREKGYWNQLKKEIGEPYIRSE